MNKFYETYKMYANVAYTWYEGNSDLKKATKIALVFLTLTYVISMAIIYYIFKYNDNTVFILGGFFLVLTFFFWYLVKEAYNIILVCIELEKQEKFWTENSKFYQELPDNFREKERTIFIAVQNVIKEKLEIKKELS